jgi:PAS domain S-box-containing protein
MRNGSVAKSDSTPAGSPTLAAARWPASRSLSALRIGLVLFATACTAVAVIVSSTLLVTHAHSDRTTMDAQAQRVADNGAQFFEREIATVEALLNGLAVSPALRTGDLASFYDQSIRVAKPIGSFILLYDRDRASVDGQSALINTNLPFGVPTPAQESETRIAVNEMVKKVVATRQTQISDVVFATVKNADVVGVCIPIIQDNAVRYALCSALDATESMRVFDAELPPEWFAGMLDQNGKFPAAKRMGERGANAPVLGSAWLQHFHESKGTFDALTADRRALHVVYSHVDDTGWISTVAVPVVTLEAPIWQALLTAGAAGASLLLTVACVAFIAAPRITRPLQRRITEDEARFREMAKTVPCVLYTANAKGECDYISERFYAYTGLPPGTALKRGWMSALHPNDRTAILARLAARDGNEKSPVLEVRLKNAEGAYRWFALRHSLMSDASENPATWFGTATDIDDLKRAEIDHRRLSRLLLKAQDDARRQIARELHDTTAQNLVAANLQLGLLSTARFSAGDVAVLDTAQELIVRSLDELRTLAYLLHPPMLDEFGLVSAIRWYIKGFERRSGVDVIFTAPDDIADLPADIESALYRVVQEGLTNVHRHAGSSKASVTLEQLDDGVVSLEITDEGKGLPSFSLDPDSSDTASLGVGIPGMRLRLEEFGGSLEIASDSYGTTLRATLPQRPPITANA